MNKKNNFNYIFKKHHIWSKNIIINYLMNALKKYFLFLVFY